MFFLKRLRNGALLVIAVLLPLFNARAALVLSGTRVIFPASENQVSIKVDNPTDNDYLMRGGWVEDDAGKPQQDILVEPPVAQIKANHKVELRLALLNRH